MALKNICSYKCRVSLFKPPSGGFFNCVQVDLTALKPDSLIMIRPLKRQTNLPSLC